MGRLRSHCLAGALLLGALAAKAEEAPADDDDDGPRVITDLDGASWARTWHQLLCSLVLYALLIVLVKIKERLIPRKKPSKAHPETFAVDEAYKHFIAVWVGDDDTGDLPQKELLQDFLACGQLIGSLLVVCCWVVKAYRMEVPYCVHVLDCICCFLFFAHTVFVILRKGATATVLSAHVLVDCLTIPWLCLQKTPSIRGSSWLSPGYLRVYFVMSGTSTLAGSSNLEWLPEIAVKGAQTAVEFLGLIVLLAGTMWTLELLGETSFDDVYFAADMGDISFYQMVYFTFITMSTVGYGDYSPVTVLGRAFVFVLILVGVTFFSYATVQLVELQGLQASGKGRYRLSSARARRNGHVIVAGSAAQCGQRFAIEAFLRNLVADHESAPEVVILARTPCSEEVQSMLREPWARHVFYFIGSLLNSDDLERVCATKSKMTFVLCNINSSKPDDDDDANILRAATFTRQCPRAPLRLVVLRVNKLKVASNLGLPRSWCFALNSLKTSLAATNSLCPGVSTLVLNLVLRNVARPPHIRATDVPPWLARYMASTCYAMRGLMLDPSFAGKTFREAALECAKVGVLLLAVQSQETGQIVLNPSRMKLGRDTVAFGIDDGDDDYLEIADPRCADGPEVWVEALRECRRRTAAKRIHRVEQHTPAKQANAVFQQDTSPESREVTRQASSLLPVIGNLSSLMEADKNEGRKQRAAIEERRDLPRAESPVKESSGLASLAKQAKQFKATSSIGGHVIEAEHSYLTPLEVVEAGGHIVVALQGDFLWAQLSSLCSALRSRTKTPILAIGDVEAPSNMFDGDGRAVQTSDLFFVRGNLQSVSFLEDAGLPRAESFVALGVLAADNTDEMMIDLPHDLLAAIVESQLGRWGRSKDLPLVYDFFSSKNLDQLPRRVKVEDAPDVGVRANLRYVAGEVLPRNEVLGSYAIAYSTPGALEVVDSLIQPFATDQKACLLDILLRPEHVGKPYAEVAALAIERGAVPLGTVRAPHEEDPDREGPVSCSVLMGPLDTVPIGPGDRLVVLASLGWARANSDVGAPPRFPGDHEPSVSISMQTQAKLAGKLLGAARRAKAKLASAAPPKSPPKVVDLRVTAEHSPTVDPWPADRRPSMEESPAPLPDSDPVRLSSK